MDHPAHVVRLELWLDGDSPTGRASVGGKPERQFAGWIGLMAAVEALVSGGREPGARADSTTWEEEPGDAASA